MAVQIKTQSRIYKVACMTISGMRDERIAAIVGLSASGLATLKQRQDYKDLVGEKLAGTITRWDEELAGDVKALRTEFAVGIPLAMRSLIDAVQQKKDLKASIEAAKELLDRDPQQVFPKSSRVVPENTGPSLSEGLLKSIGAEADAVATQIAPPKEAIN